jgi:AcrR family transcriptional regulator
MSDKSVQKKKYIIEKAREIFIEKGFVAVTMKDIVEACDISRGGLYLYFPDTDAVFQEVMKLEAEESGDSFSGIREDSTVSEILALFFKEQKKELLHMRDTLAAAKYEYYFFKKTDKKDNLIRTQMMEATKMLEKLIALGSERGEFAQVDPKQVAENIVYMLEGLKVTALTSGISEKIIDRELMILMQRLITED